ncbi:MAG TPA: MmgE/PrpD family protein [Rhodopila sp.]|nr:MmgE/PrpD family protein [Rhodopila sp.]
MTQTAPLLAHATRDLARFAAGLRFEDIPAAVVEHAKLCVLDGLGVALFGAGLPWTGHVRAVALAEGATPVASFWGTPDRGSVAQAALVNGTAGHAFEMDDIHKESIVHPNSLACPVAFAFAEAAGGMAGRDVLTAIVAGYEVGTRVGNAATMALFLRGFHPQGTSGVFVAAATAGRILGLPAEQMQHALGIAGSMGAGLMAAQEGAMVKRLHAGRAAQSGVQAALLARRGFTGILDVLEAGYGGFLSSLSGRPNASRLTAGLGSVWETAEVGFKLFPSVTSIHTALDALDTVMADQGLRAEDIERISVGCSHMTFVHTAWPYKPAGVTAAQMNLFYGLAVIALHRDASVRQYGEERLADPAILAFIQRISAFEDDGLEAMGAPFRHAARVEVTTRDGRVFRHERLGRRGSPDDPVGPAAIVRKFDDCVRGVLSDDDAAALRGLVMRLDTLDDTGDVSALLRSGR